MRDPMMRDQQPIEHERLDELYSSGRGFFGRNMKTVLRIFFVIGLFYLLTAPGRAAKGLCENHPVGTPITNIEDIEGSFLLNRMGPFPDPDQPGVQSAIFCVSLTLCDTSCRLSVKDGLVIKSEFSAI
jgi:hypothetical protein